jgi:hypothetical protein
VRRQFAQQDIVPPPAFQQVNHFITQTQVCKIGVWVIFYSGQSWQIASAFIQRISHKCSPVGYTE